MSDKFSGKKPDDIPQSEWDASIAFKNRGDASSMSACEFIARARMDAKAEERAAFSRHLDNPPSYVLDAMAAEQADGECRNGHGRYGYRDMWRAGVAAILNRKGA